MVKIDVIQTGSVLVSKAIPDRSSIPVPLAYTGIFQGKKQRIQLPVKTFLVEVEGRKILIDAGWHEDCVDKALAHLGFPLWFSSIPVMKKGEGLREQLEARQIDLKEIDALLMTHIDCDHASGLTALRDIENIYVAKEELEAENFKTVRYNKNFIQGVNFRLYAMTEDKEAPFGQSFDLFGDGSVMIYLTPTHAKGLVAIKVTQGEDFVIFTGDNAYTRASWEQGKLPGPMYNVENMKKVLVWLKAQSENPKCKGIYTSHDPEILAGEYSF